MPVINDEIFSAMRMFEEDPTTKRAFCVVEEEGGRASGWRIAKSQDADPGSVQKALQKLRRLGVVESTSKGLEGYYYLTSLGFRLQELLPKQMAK